MAVSNKHKKMPKGQIRISVYYRGHLCQAHLVKKKTTSISQDRNTLREIEAKFHHSFQNSQIK
jgi:hypothetical protein